MSDEYKDPQDEIVKRTRRMETKITKIASRLGVDATPGKERAVLLTNDVMQLSGLDISLGDLLDACRKSGINGKVALHCNEFLVGYFQLGDRST